jgi:hypothetical protein
MAGVLVTAAGRKHEVPARLAAAVRDALAETADAAALHDVVARVEKSARVLIAGAPTGSLVEVRASVLPDPVLGWSASLMVDAAAGPPRRRVRKKR